MKLRERLYNNPFLLNIFIKKILERIKVVSNNNHNENVKAPITPSNPQTSICE